MDLNNIRKSNNQIRLDGFHAALVSEYGMEHGEDIFSFACSIIGDAPIRFRDDPEIRDAKIRCDLYDNMSREDIARKYGVSLSTVNHAVSK